MAGGPFEFLNSINFTKVDLTDQVDKQYNPFLTNRALSYSQDTLFLSNEMNQRTILTKKQQYRWYLNIVRKGKRFSKWAKTVSNIDVEAIKLHFGCSDQKALEALKILSPADLELIKTRIQKDE